LNPLKLKFSRTSTQKGPSELYIKKIGGWTGYFIKTGDTERQVTKHAYMTHPNNITKLREISKAGVADEADKPLVDYYKKLVTQEINFKGDDIDVSKDITYNSKDSADSETGTNTVDSSDGQELKTVEDTDGGESNIDAESHEDS